MNDKQFGGNIIDFHRFSIVLSFAAVFYQADLFILKQTKCVTLLMMMRVITVKLTLNEKPSDLLLWINCEPNITLLVSSEMYTNHNAKYVWTCLTVTQIYLTLSQPQILHKHRQTKLPIRMEI